MEKKTITATELEKILEATGEELEIIKKENDGMTYEEKFESYVNFINSNNVKKFKKDNE